MNTRFILLICALLISTNSYANMHKLLKEFLDSNHSIRSNRSRINIANFELDIIKNKRPFVVGANALMSSNNLDAISASQKQDIEYDAYSVNLSKEFIWGGAVTFSNKLTRYDRRETSALLLAGANPIVSEFKHSISYSQDLGDNFLGRIDKAETLQAEQNFEFINSDSGNVEQSAIFSFYNYYLDAELKKTLLELERRAWKRSIRRKKLIARRVRDGLREKADLLQAKMEEISKYENVQRSLIELKQSIDILSGNLHRKVAESELQEFDFKAYTVESVGAGKGKDENFDVRSSQKLIGLLQTEHKKSDFSVFPKVSVVASYSSNNFNETDHGALSDGTMGDNREKSLALNLTWPIGFDVQKKSRAKALVKLKSEEYRHNSLKKNVKVSRELLLKELVVLKDNLNSVKKRRLLAFKLLKEYTKLYNLGKADIDQVIRSEEGLIATEKSYASYIVMRKIKIAKLKMLEGSLHKFFNM